MGGRTREIKGARLENKPQQITETCLLENAKAILRLYENDITQHVVKQQLRGDRMDEILRRQITYQEGGVKQQRRVTVNRLAKSSLFGRDPTGEHPLPESMYDDEGELTEKGALLKDVQDTVWDYLRVHLPRILAKPLMDRVQAVEETYKTMPELREEKVNNRMPWSEYRENITYLLPRDTGMYALSKVLTLMRESAETALSFATRLNKGKQKVSKKMNGNNLSDECYVELLLGALTKKEKAELPWVDLITRRTT